MTLSGTRGGSVLFSMLSEETCQALRNHNYQLVIDEAVESVSVYDKLTRSDVRLLLSKGLVEVDEDGRLAWTGDDALDDGKGLGRDMAEFRYKDVRTLCRNRAMFLYGESALIWELPTYVLRHFTSVMVLTYMWEASPMCAYLKAEGVPVEVYGMERGSGLPRPRGLVSEREVKAYVRRHLKVIDGDRMNCIGAAPKRTLRAPSGEPPKRPLSATWYRTASPAQREAVSTKVESFAKHGPQSINDFGWTTFSEQREKIERARFAKDSCWLPCNARASNDYRDKTHLAYMIDVYQHPNITNYFRSRGVKVSGELFALSEMLQWLWRGCIRCYDGRDMTVYVPSERMRNLLRLWLDCDSLGEVYEALGVELS